MRGDDDCNQAIDVQSNIFPSLLIMHICKSHRRRISLALCLGFMLQMLAIGVCQMGSMPEAMAANSSEQHICRLMPMEHQAMPGMPQSVMHDQSTPRSDHSIPCSHCNQPDELVSTTQLSDVSILSVSLLQAGDFCLPPLMQVGRTITLTVWAPPTIYASGNKSIIYRTSQRLRI